MCDRVEKFSYPVKYMLNFDYLLNSYNQLNFRELARFWALSIKLVWKWEPDALIVLRKLSHWTNMKLRGGLILSGPISKLSGEIQKSTSKGEWLFQELFCFYFQGRSDRSTEYRITTIFSCPYLVKGKIVDFKLIRYSVRSKIIS